MVIGMFEDQELIEEFETLKEAGKYMSRKKHTDYSSARQCIKRVLEGRSIKGKAYNYN